jgi:hypothetical protein
MLMGSPALVLWPIKRLIASSSGKHSSAATTLDKNRFLPIA